MSPDRRRYLADHAGTQEEVRMMTEQCRKGASLIWMQCDGSRFAEGFRLLEEAAGQGDADAWYLLGRCYSWGGGDVGFSEDRAAECYRKGIEGGSALAVLGALRAGLYDASMREISDMTPDTAFRKAREAAEAGDAFAAWQLAETIEWDDLAEERRRLIREKEQEIPVEDLLEDEEPEEEPPEQEEADASAKTEDTAKPLLVITVPGECILWYRKAAEGGIIQAMEHAGKLALAGTYRESDPADYSRWVEKSAAAGSAWGLCELGIYYASAGENPTAREYLLAADAQGEPRAALPLGRLYLAAEEEPDSFTQAITYLEKAADAGDAESYRVLATVFDKGIRTERDVPKAIFWYQKAFRAGDGEAALLLGKLYLEDTEEKNGEKAVHMLEQAAEKADPLTAGEACRILGQIYHDGLGGVPDGEWAIHWYTAGAGFGNAECMERLGLMYCLGEEGIPADYGQAFLWLNRCWENGTLRSCSRLAGLYLRGEGCEADEEKAIRLFETAARTEYDGYACCELGRIYERRGTEEDLEKAVEYYGKSMDMGNETAARRLARFKRGPAGRWRVEEED